MSGLQGPEIGLAIDKAQPSLTVPRLMTIDLRLLRLRHVADG